MKKLLFIATFVLLFSVSAQITIANVLIEDTRTNSMVDDNGFGEGTIASGSGQTGNYVIFTCSAPNDLGNDYNNPTPGTWTRLDVGACGNDGTLCSHGIWGGFIDDPNSADINCSWTQNGTVFTAAAMRFSNVDKFAPIGEVVCESGIAPVGVQVHTPEVIAEAGSQVLGMVTLSQPTNNTINNLNSEENPFITTNGITTDSVIINAESQSQDIGTAAGSIITPVDDTISPVSFVAFDVPGEYRMCSIVIRMGASTVPTMSEWGLISFAAFAGIAGVWYLRRRRAAA